MNITELAFVLSAGAFTLLSPCGYPALIAYLSYWARSELSFRKTLVGGSIGAAGFLSVFFLIGLAPSILGQMVLNYVPILIVVAGIMIIVFGILTIFGAKFSIRIPMIKPVGRTGFVGVFIFGLAFGMATAACSAPIFLAVILLAMTQGGVLNVVYTLIVYSLGMGVPVIVSVILVATAREKVLKKLVRWRPWLDRISGVLMILVGIYLIYYYFSIYGL